MRGGLSVNGDCLLLAKAGWLPTLDSVREALTDKTGYECFVNHAHFKEKKGDSIAALRHAVAFCKRISSEARRAARNRILRFIIGKNGNDWTVRFHTLRPDESWVTDDLESYAEEAILVLDSSELLPRNIS